MMKIKRIVKFKHKTLITGLSIISITLVGYTLYASYNHLPPFQLASPLPGDYTINQQKSDAEKQQTQKLKDDPSQKIINQQTDTPSTPTVDKTSNKQIASVVMTYASIQNETASASGFVSNVTEDGGVCTYVFTKGSLEVKEVSSPMSNPTSTTCSTVNFPASQLSSGLWSVKLVYSSTSSYGESSAKEITKP